MFFMFSNDQFGGQAREVVDICLEESHDMIYSVQEIANSFTSAALMMGTDGNFPYLTIPHFELRGTGNNELTSAEHLAYAPLITQEDKATWEAYAYSNQGWVDESLAYAQTLHGHNLDDSHRAVQVLDRNVSPLSEGFGSSNEVETESDPAHPSISKYVYRFEDGTIGNIVPQNGPGLSVGPGNYAPIWQIAPVAHDPKLVNFDLLSHPAFASAYEKLWESRMPVVSRAAHIEFFDGDDMTHEKNDDSPHSVIIQPLYSSFEVGADSDALVGLLASEFAWEKFLARTLPSVHGIVVVVDDQCGTQMTFMSRIDGGVTYLGESDMHDSQYTSMRVKTKWAPFLVYPPTTGTEYACDYVISIYPSMELEAVHKNKNPAIYATVVGFVFFITAVIFLVYDYFGKCALSQF